MPWPASVIPVGQVWYCWPKAILLWHSVHLNFNDFFVSIRFDVAGAGACLKRYSDPSFYKTELASTETKKAKREKKSRKIKVKFKRAIRYHQ